MAINLLNILSDIKTFIFGKGKARKLFDQLKSNPDDPNALKEIKELFVNDPVGVVTEVLRRINANNKSKDDSTPDTVGTMRQTWENTIKKEKVQPLLYKKPVTKQDLIDIIINAEKDNMLVRAVGAGHSFSDVANATDVLVDMTKIKLPADTDRTFKDRSMLRPNATGLLYIAESGMMVSDLNAALDGLNLALPTMAAFDQETIYGAIATSTHGTGLNVSGMANMVRSMDMVAHGGKVYRLEPTAGITDPVKFQASPANKDITLIQDDDKFYSSVVGFGLMGIVYSIVIEPVKRFYLEQRLWLTHWDEVKPRLENRTFFTAIDADWKQETKIDATTKDLAPTRAQVFVNPYLTKNFITKKEGHTCTVQIQREITKDEYDKKETTPKTNKILALFKLLLSNGSKGMHEETIEAEDKNSITEELSTEGLLLILNDFPVLTPLFLDISLILLLSGSGKFGKSYVVMNQGKLAIKNAGYSSEPGLAVDKSDQFIAGSEKIMEVVKISETASAYLTGPFCMRFVKKSEDHLSPEYNTDTCMIDITMLLGTIGDDQMLDRMQLDLVALGARPHWGKICNLVNGDELIRKMYPKYQTFLDTVEFFNPTGTFNSIFSYRTGISKMAYERK